MEKTIKAKLNNQDFSKYIQALTLDTGPLTEPCKYNTTEEHNALISKKNPRIKKYDFKGINIRSFDKHFGNFIALTEAMHHPSFIGISEIGKKNIRSRKKQLKHFGYNLKFEEPDKVRGGVGLAYDSSIDVKKRSDLKIKKPTNLRDIDLENIWYQTNLPTIGKTVIAVIYKHPNSTVKGLDYFREALKTSIKKVNQEKMNLIIIGDINIDGLRVNHNENVKKFFTMTLENDVLPIITLPTRIQDDKVSTIDHIFINNHLIRNTTHRLGGNIYHDISDHLPVFLTIDNNRDAPELKERAKIRIYGEKNKEKFKEELAQTNWDAVLLSTDPDTALDEFYEKINSVINKCFPIKTISRKRTKDKPWINLQLRKKILRRDRLFKTKTLRPTLHNKEAHKQFRNQVNKELEQAETLYYREKLNSDKKNLKNLWDIAGSIINPKKSKKRNFIKQLIIDKKRLTKDQDIADGINNFFSTIGNKLAEEITVTKDFRDYLGKPNEQSIEATPTTLAEITKIINNLQGKKAGGDDGIRPLFLKLGVDYVSRPILHIVNLSIKHCKVPDKLKIAKVIPVHKKKDKDLPGNYRPISLLSSINKILEKVMCKRLTDFLEKQKIIFKYQFGFRKKHSTIQAVIEIVDNIIEYIEKGFLVAGVYLDLSKAFDCVDHEILLYKLHHYGIRGDTHRWLQDYLSNRKQFTHVNGTDSKLQTVNIGVPQGSVLGPLLFIVYVNDIAAATGADQVRLFADDSNIFVADKDPAVLKNKMVDKMCHLNLWFTSNKMTNNVSKAAYSIFTNQSTIPATLNTVTIGNDTIERVKYSRYLGLQLDDKLEWNEHLEILKSKLRKTIQAFKIVKNYLTDDQKRIMYYSYFFSRLQYGIELFGHTSKGQMKELQVIQNRALKALYKKDFRTPTKELHKSCKIILVKDIQQLNILKFVFKQRKGEAPEAFKNYFTENSAIHRHETRQANNLHPTKPKTGFGKKSIKYYGANLWNALTKNARKTDVTLKCFSKNLKEMLLEGY